ncbi:MAG: hypothetical protein KKF62_01475 [Bacteroidetes bacterium]|nr:hypothetical protein [Bacteroidota bacterium]MBU1114174.1 hypothetical protein [Bacteroidota bacterium]MBU1800532.1 hypothetical protein [Bacteroidota bacterium]
MNIFPLINKDQHQREKINNMKIQIPSAWWTSNYSFNLADEQKPLIHLNRKLNISNIPPTPGWDIKKGDYRAKVTKVSSKDYVYHRDLKLKIIKYSLYPVVIITILLIAKVSEYLSRI